MKNGSADYRKHTLKYILSTSARHTLIRHYFSVVAAEKEEEEEDELDVDDEGEESR